MSEKHQHTAAWMRRAMDGRYGDEHHHKHDKRHHTYRHVRTHPVQFNHVIAPRNESVNNPTGEIRALNLQKIRKRLTRKMFRRH